MTRIAPLLLLPVLALGVAACGDDDDGEAANTAASTYEIMVTNLNDNQPFTPPVAATHAEENEFFAVGSAAPAEIQAIAENGNNEPALGAWLGAVQGAETPLAPSGTPGGEMFPDTATFTITSEEGQGYLSLASMLICTNDGFTGTPGLALPASGESVTVMANAYDAGTENNTETLADMVPPCQDLSGVTSEAAGVGESNPDLAEGGDIAVHPGIEGSADLTADAHGFTGPVLEITVTNVG